MNTIYECIRGGVKEFKFLTPPQVAARLQNGWKIRKVRDTK